MSACSLTANEAPRKSRVAGRCGTRKREEGGITRKVVGVVRRRAQQSECGPGLSAASSTRQLG